MLGQIHILRHLRDYVFLKGGVLLIKHPENLFEGEIQKKERTIMVTAQIPWHSRFFNHQKHRNSRNFWSFIIWLLPPFTFCIWWFLPLSNIIFHKYGGLFISKKHLLETLDKRRLLLPISNIWAALFYTLPVSFASHTS